MAADRAVDFDSIHINRRAQVADTEKLSTQGNDRLNAVFRQAVTYESVPMQRVWKAVKEPVCLRPRVVCVPVVDAEALAKQAASESFVVDPLCEQDSSPQRCIRLFNCAACFVFNPPSDWEKDRIVRYR